MKHVHRMALLLGAVISLNSAWGQSAERTVSNQDHTWLMAFGNHRLTETWGLHTEYQFRRTGWGGGWQQSLLRVGLDRHLQDGAMLTAGYGWIRSFPYGEQPIAETFDEHRIWQQLITQSQTGPLKWLHRYRLEQRYMDRKDNPSWQHRVRYFVQVTCPLPSKPQWSFSAYEEAFVGLRSLTSPTVNLLQQNRLALALNRAWASGTSVQLGYLHQVLWKGDGLRVEQNHTLLLGVRHDLDVRK